MKMKDVPRKIDKNKDGSYMYPDRKSWHDALRQYAKDNDIDVDVLIKGTEKKYNKTYKDFIKGTKK